LAAGIRVPDFRLALAARKPVLLLRRFDRDRGRRVPFMSAMTALSADENQVQSYLGIVHDGVGWRLAPAFDLNPMPADVRPRVHAPALDDMDATASMDTVWEVAPRFGLATKEARRIAHEVAASVRTWRSAGKQHGLKPKELDRMASAFEHEDLAGAAR
jgi:serine/threonine-protein kinase HipA